jgi:hypothetical protein
MSKIWPGTKTHPLKQWYKLFTTGATFLQGYNFVPPRPETRHEADMCLVRADGRYSVFACVRADVSVHRNAGCAELALDGGCRVCAC